jgi:hypothetical protein
MEQGSSGDTTYTGIIIWELSVHGDGPEILVLEAQPIQEREN